MNPAMNIERIRVDHFRVPLPVVLSDSTHGDMSHFGLVTVRIDCAGGHHGVGYTYCVGDIGGAAIRSLIDRELAPLLMGAVDIALWDLGARAGPGVAAVRSRVARGAHRPRRRGGAQPNREGGRHTHCHR